MSADKRKEIAEKYAAHLRDGHQNAQVIDAAMREHAASVLEEAAAHLLSSRLQDECGFGQYNAGLISASNALLARAAEERGKRDE